MVTHGNREGGGEVTGLPGERGGVTPAHTGDPPPRGIIASNTGGPQPTKVKFNQRSVGLKTRVMRMLG